MKNKPIFEFETCGRCGGCGQYSYCQRYGTTCFGCGGRGTKLTKRGEAAQQLYTRMASKRADQVVPGDVIWCDNVIGKSGWSVVETSARPTDGSGYISPEGGHYQTIHAWYISTKLLGMYISRHDVVRVRQSVEQRAGILDVCIAYQRSLGKDGKVSKSLTKIMREVAF